jgi:hypothetical protein
MKELMHPETTKFVVCHNGEDVFHYSIVTPEDGLVTGQPFMDIFDSEEEVKVAFPNLIKETVNDIL